MLSGSLYHPLEFHERLSILDSNAGESDSKWMESLHKSEPLCVAGTPAQLDLLAERKLTQPRFLSSVAHSLLSIHRAGAAALSESARDRLWRAFGVPVFELVYNSTGRLLAYECPARQHWHSGSGLSWKADPDGSLHYRTRRNWFNGPWVTSGFKGRLVEGLCPCGRAGLRLQLDLPAAQPDRPIRSLEIEERPALPDLAVQAVAGGTGG